MKANHILSMHVFNSNLLIQKNVKTNGLPGFGIPCLQQSTGTLVVKLQGLKCPLSKYVGKIVHGKVKYNRKTRANKLCEMAAYQYP